MTELLPCPLCGGHPLMLPRAVICLDWWQCVIVHDGDDGDDGHLVRIIATGDTEQEATEAAVAAWNRRYERTTTMTTDAGSQHWYSCDTCEHDGYAAELPNFCPHCGRKVMRDE